MKTRTGTALIVTLMGVAERLRCRAAERAGDHICAVRPSGLKIVMIAKNTTNPIFVSARKGAEVAARSSWRSTASPSRLSG